MTVALIALGNELRRDDGIAAAVCRLLPAAMKQRVRYFELGIHGDQIASCLSGASAAIVVDAVLAPGSVGTVETIDVSEALIDTSICSSHGLSWLQELRFSNLNVPVTFVGIHVMDDGWGEGICKQLIAAKPTIVGKLADICASTLELNNA